MTESSLYPVVHSISSVEAEGAILNRSLAEERTSQVGMSSSHRNQQYVLFDMPGMTGKARPPQ